MKLETAVLKRLMSDVPAGVYLSGGLDGSLIAAMMRPHTVDLFSFTAGIAGAPDLAVAKFVAEYLSTRHYELTDSCKKAARRSRGRPLCSSTLWCCRFCISAL